MGKLENGKKYRFRKFEPQFLSALFFLFVALQSVNLNAQTVQAIPKNASLVSYNDLLRQVRTSLALGKERTEEAVERERVRTAWEVGKLIISEAFYGKRIRKGPSRYARHKQTGSIRPLSGGGVL